MRQVFVRELQQRSQCRSALSGSRTSLSLGLLLTGIYPGIFIWSLVNGVCQLLVSLLSELIIVKSHHSSLSYSYSWEGTSYSLCPVELHGVSSHLSQVLFPGHSNPQRPCHLTILTPQGREWGVCLQQFPPSGKRAQVPIFTSHSLQKSFPCSESFCCCTAQVIVIFSPG